MATNATSGWLGTTVDLAPEAEDLPLTAERGSSGTVPKVLLAGLLVAALLGAVVAVALSAQGVPVMHVVAPAGLALAGLAALSTIILFATARQTWQFDEAEVRYTREGLLGRREWSEPLSAYRGVLRKQELRSTGKSSYMVYMVQLLKEGDKKHTVTLYQSLKKDDLRPKHEHYARLFGLPALTQTEDGVQERRPEDLNKTVRELVAEGRVEVELDPAVPPPGKRLAVRVDGDALGLQVKSGAIGSVRWILPAIMAAVGAVMGSLAVVDRGAPVSFAYLGVGLPVGAASLTWFLVGLREELRVSPAEVRKWWTWHGRRFGERAVRADYVEEVVVAEPIGSKGTKTVQAVTEDATVHFGRGLNKAERHWVRDCIIAVISR